MSEKNKRSIISESKRKNLQEVVYHNVDDGGNKDSITRFEPLVPGKNVYSRFGASRKEGRRS
jgi:hypothetical protein